MSFGPRQPCRGQMIKTADKQAFREALKSMGAFPIGPLKPTKKARHQKVAGFFHYLEGGCGLCRNPEVRSNPPQVLCLQEVRKGLSSFISFSSDNFLTFPKIVIKK